MIRPFLLFLVCVSAACVCGVRAAVIATSFDPPLFANWPGPGEGTRKYTDLDLNGDGELDFRIASHQGGINLEALGGNEIACGAIFAPPEVGGFAQTIHAGEIIGAYQAGYNYDWTPGFGAMVGINAITSPPQIYGYWGSNRDYLGVRFDIGGETHYGWIQVYMPATEGMGYIEGFAYETEPGKAIIAGAVPEPGSFLLAGIGALLLFGRGRKMTPSKSGTSC